MEKGNWRPEKKFRWGPESEKRLNWGPESKEDDKQFLKALLDGTKTSAGDKLSKFEWQDESSEHPKLHIQTEKKFWYKDDGKDNSNKLSYDQLRAVIKRFEYLKIITSSDSSRGSKLWKFDLQLWSKDTATNLSKFEEIYGKEYKEPKNPKEPEQGSPNNPSAVDTSDMDVEQSSDIEQQSIENKKLSYSDPLLDCAFFQGRQNDIYTDVSKKTILVLALGSIAQPKQELQNEVRRIKNALKQSPDRDKFDVKEKFVASYEDLEAVFKVRPWIVHFSEYGNAKVEELALENEKNGKTQLVNIFALTKIFKVFAAFGVECVILNSGYSKLHAKLISLYINYVIAMEQVNIDDIIRFSIGFYTQLGEDILLEKVYQSGCSLIELRGQSENSPPLFFQRNNTIEQLKNYGLKSQKILDEIYTVWNKKTESCYRNFNSDDYKPVLDELQKQHDLLPEEAIAINYLGLEPYQQEEEQIKKYEQTLEKVVERSGVLTEQNRKLLKAWQDSLNISNKKAGRAYNNIAICLLHNDKLNEAVALLMNR
ncbi:MAG: hypothetical protein N4J56_007280 [Chroococcidiopsis sp. SAG 2025]|uniref:hypothetical protein n=1 Tax=Chroococcidiopsis sp. SAG 2025 TaxID=171389 RepID=UPI00293743B5|nr:hypothetical protein [Chroococcidiopsis sp. SAG 2025]MDV2997575.1 hypothetical protein [Chroococcidiopsis sp. SAG 2025]